MKNNTSKRLAQLCLILLLVMRLQAQTLLEADATGNAYTVINSVLAPGGTAVETPDQTSGGSAVGSHPSFGRHIQMVYDAELGKYVFQFLIHVNSVLDNDISTGDNDRQRVEMKTYATSPANLKGTIGENITYKWKFRLPVGFQPSSNFTHIHQIKAVDGDDSSPLFTITPRYKASGNVLELIYVKDSTTSNFYCATAPLSNFLGVWVEATEQITVGANGTYSMTIRRVSDNAVLLSYSNNNIQTIRASNSFVRPKWGIYRSITTAYLLRDDSLRIASVSITENQPLPVAINSFIAKPLTANTVWLNWHASNEVNLDKYIVERSASGVDFSAIGAIDASNMINYKCIDSSALAGTNYYRLKALNKDGSFTYSAIVSVVIAARSVMSLSPNPTNNFVKVNLNTNSAEKACLRLLNNCGQIVKTVSVNAASQPSVLLSLAELVPGFYTLQLLNNGQQVSAQKLLKQ